jgi:hypothetical protein
MTFLKRLISYCLIGALVWFCLQVAVIFAFFAAEKIGAYPLLLLLWVTYWPDLFFEQFHPLPTNWGGTGGPWWLIKSGISLGGWIILAGLVAGVRQRWPHLFQKSATP